MTMQAGIYGDLGLVDVSEDASGYGMVSPMKDGRSALFPTGDLRTLPEALVESLRAEFLRLIEPKNFLENLPILEGLTRSTRQLVMTLGVTPEALKSLHPQMGLSGNGHMHHVRRQDPEQFGARAIRELVAMVPDAIAKTSRAQSGADDPVKLVAALDAAKRAGLAHVAAKIEAHLGDLFQGSGKPEEGHCEGCGIESGSDHLPLCTKPSTPVPPAPAATDPATAQGEAP